MKKNVVIWTIKELMDNINRIDFPEYQREPTIWNRSAKQRLIDSIIRGFDVASIYLYRHKDDHWDCIDGRQRIAAIRSFRSDGGTDKDEHSLDRRDIQFKFKVLNEIFDDEEHPFLDVDEMDYQAIKDLANLGNKVAQDFMSRFEAYPLTVVEMSDTKEAQEFNLQFTRLNLGVLINSGEKLHAMVGDLRDACFEDLGKHLFLEQIDIPTRRYAKEQLAAQIVAQVFAIEDSKRNGGVREFTSIGYLDLQYLFKFHANLGEIGSDRRRWITRIGEVMDLLSSQVNAIPRLRSRAIVLSLFLLAYEQKISNVDEARQIANFAKSFLEQLRIQTDAGIEIDRNYLYLMNFQHNLSQGSSRKASVRDRARVLERGFSFWKDVGELMKEKDYRKIVAGGED